MDDCLAAVERLFEQQSCRLEELRESHAALAQALSQLRCRRGAEAGAATVGEAATAAAVARGRQREHARLDDPGYDVGSLGPQRAWDDQGAAGAEHGAALWSDAGVAVARQRMRGDARWDDPVAAVVGTGRQRGGVYFDDEAAGVGGQQIGACQEAYSDIAGFDTAFERDERLSSSAMKVLAAAHERGYVLDDLPGLPAEEWQRLGATRAEQADVLQALQRWRKRIGSPASTPPASFEARREHLYGGVVLTDGDGSWSQSRGDDVDGRGHRRRHIAPPDHIVAGTAVGDGAGSHGHSRCDDVQGGCLPRGIGSGKHHANRADHLFGAAFQNGTETDRRGPSRVGRPRPGTDHIYGGSTASDYPSEPPHGRRYIAAKDHMWADASTDDTPGSHGHLKDAGFEGGLARFLGHGRRHYDRGEHFENGFGLSDVLGTQGGCKDDDFHLRRRPLEQQSPANAGAAGRGTRPAMLRSPSAPAAGVPNRYQATGPGGG